MFNLNVRGRFAGGSIKISHFPGNSVRSRPAERRKTVLNVQTRASRGFKRFPLPLPTRILPFRRENSRAAWKFGFSFANDDVLNLQPFFHRERLFRSLVNPRNHRLPLLREFQRDLSSIFTRFLRSEKVYPCFPGPFNADTFLKYFSAEFSRLMKELRIALNGLSSFKILICL